MKYNLLFAKLLSRERLPINESIVDGGVALLDLKLVTDDESSQLFCFAHILFFIVLQWDPWTSDKAILFDLHALHYSEIMLASKLYNLTVFNQGLMHLTMNDLLHLMERDTHATSLHRMCCHGNILQTRENWFWGAFYDLLMTQIIFLAW